MSDGYKTTYSPTTQITLHLKDKRSLPWARVESVGNYIDLNSLWKVIDVASGVVNCEIYAIRVSDDEAAKVRAKWDNWTKPREASE